MSFSALLTGAISALVAAVQARATEITLMVTGVIVGAASSSWLDNINGFAAGAGALLVMAFLAYLTRRRDNVDMSSKQATNAINFSQILQDRLGDIETKVARLEQQIVIKDREIEALRGEKANLEGIVSRLALYCQALFAVLQRVAPDEAARIGDPAMYGIAPPTQPLPQPLPAPLTISIAQASPAASQTQREAVPGAAVMSAPARPRRKRAVKSAQTEEN
jgi:hypothetical protein